MEGPSSSNRHHAAATIKISTAGHRTLLAGVDSTHPLGITTYRQDAKLHREQTYCY
jgi:hypothetical protein